MILLKRGAEADLYFMEWYGLNVVIKRRVSKAYRVSPLDLEIRRFRTVHEAQLIHSAKAAGVPTPAIYSVNPNDMEIIMSYIDGQIVKEVLDVIDEDARLQICRKIGNLISKLHTSGIIHGDLTTSNMVLTRTGEVSLIDFGLGDFSGELEERGVDLLLAKRALYSTHINSAEKCFKALCEAYEDEVGEKEALAVFKRVKEIERRGRYVPER
jgi:TP53 regulating kinase-like protein